MRDVLLIDDDADILQSLTRALSALIQPLTQCATSTPSAAEQLFISERPRVVVLDLCLDEKVGVESGFSLLKRLRALDDTARIIVLTGHGSTVNGIRALELGASNFLEKPCDPVHLAALIRDGAQQSKLLTERKKLLSHQRANVGALVGSSNAMQQVHDALQFAASTRQPVLLLGETGTGKSLCARLIHEASDRSAGKFISYHPNFGGADIVQSELFGHVRGAFTGALTDRNGLLREAHGGTIFLDEIDELPMETQVRLLDVIQEGRVRPIGADSFVPVDCRIITATNRPLTELLSAGKFRLDLYHRIAHFTVTLPPLRGRKEDINELATSALSRFSLRENATFIGFDDDAISALTHHDWPGNVRELNAVVEAAAYRARYERSEVIRASHLPSQLLGAPAPLTATVQRSASSSAASLHEQIESFKVKAVQEALARSNGNQVVAARELGVDRGMIRRVLRGGN